MKRLKGSFAAAAAAILATALIMFILSILVERELLPQSVTEFGPILIIALMTFAAAAVNIKKMSGKTIVTGLSVSAAVLLIVVLAGVIGFEEKSRFSLWVLLAILLGGILAGLMGGRKRKIR